MCFSLNNFFENSYLQQYNSTNNNNKKLNKNYFTTQEISNILAMNNKNDLSIFHLNTRSLAKKKRKYRRICKSNKLQTRNNCNI